MARPPTILGLALCLPLSGNGNSDRYGRYYRFRMGGDKPGAYVADDDHYPPCLTDGRSELSRPFTRAVAAPVLPTEPLPLRHRWRRGEAPSCDLRRCAYHDAMNVSDSRPPGLVPVHVGRSVRDDLADARARIDAQVSGRPSRDPRRFALVASEVEWQNHGVEPRWPGMETSDCAAALNPSIFLGQGTDELQRFLAGAGSRQETALVIVTIGNAEEDSPRSVRSRYDASVDLLGLGNSISGRRLPAGSRPRLAPELGAADRDLGLRLLNRPSDAPWWALKLSGRTGEQAFGPSITYAPKGQLRPILVDALGDAVVAVWTPRGRDQRWYIVPGATDWNGLADWLIHQALPVYVPDALRRARSPHFVDPDLQTQAESRARQALADMAVRHAEERARLEDELQRARAAAEGVRYGLLYGTDRQLVDAVDAVLTDAGFTTVNLDDDLGGTRSADLLATFQQQRRLIEIKSTSGNAPEALVGDLRRHLATWPELRPQEPVGGGVLIVNHQHKLEPSQRSLQVYSRREFVNTLTVPVISTRMLFDWWRVSDWRSIRDTVLGPAHPADGITAPPAGASPIPRPTSPTARNQTPTSPG
jgi:hypothetical protein